MDKKLICYFSATGKTRKVAIRLNELIGGDIFEIEPKILYTNEDLDWTNKNSRSSVEMQDVSSRPEIKENNLNIQEYDTIILGFPVWWYKAPTIVNTFIEKNDLKNKKIYIFVTSGSSGVESSLDNLKNEYPELNFISGKRLNEFDDSEIIEWIK